MVQYVLVHGAAGSAWEWHLVAPLLAARGHAVHAVDLPCEDPEAGLQASADVVAAASAAAAAAHPVVVVAQSFAGFTAPLACAQVRVDLLVLVCAMTPRPGERAADWWDHVGARAAVAAMAEAEGRHVDGDRDLVLDGIPPAVRAEAERQRRRQVATPVHEPWPLDAWPDVPTAFVLGTRDRFFPPALQRRVVAERLGIRCDEVDAGHVPALSEPSALVTALERIRAREGRAPHPT